MDDWTVIKPRLASLVFSYVLLGALAAFLTFVGVSAWTGWVLVQGSGWPGFVVAAALLTPLPFVHWHVTRSSIILTDTELVVTTWRGNPRQLMVSDIQEARVLDGRRAVISESSRATTLELWRTDGARLGVHVGGFDTDDVLDVAAKINRQARERGLNTFNLEQRDRARQREERIFRYAALAVLAVAFGGPLLGAPWLVLTFFAIPLLGTARWAARRRLDLRW